MGSIKHTDKPFILNPDKAEEFLNQGNERFHAAMERQEKYKRPTDIDFITGLSDPTKPLNNP